MKQFLSILLIFLGTNLFAQEIKKTQDLGLWTGLSIEYDLNKDYTLKLSQELRLFENLSEIEKYNSDLGLDYRINKKFNLGFSLRYYLNKEKDKTISQSGRYNFDIRYKEKIGNKFKIKYRLRFQTLYKNMFTAVSEKTESNFRNKISFDYKLNKQNNIYLGAEIFREIKVYRKPYFNKIRFSIGDEKKTKAGEFDFSLVYERELNSNYPLNYFIGRINYTFKLKHEK